MAENLLQRDFTASLPDQVWTSEFTFLRTDAGWLCLAIVLDPFNREALGWLLGPRTMADLVIFNNERIFGECFFSHEAMKAIAFESIEVFYNRRRLHSTLGYTPPVRFLENWTTDQRNRERVA